MQSGQKLARADVCKGKQTTMEKTGDEQKAKWPILRCRTQLAARPVLDDVTGRHGALGTPTPRPYIQRGLSEMSITLTSVPSLGH